MTTLKAILEPGTETVRRWDSLATLALCAALLAFNAGLLFGQPARLFAYESGAVLAGQWWRLLTHPFVHVSPYHALLDGAAFLLLWASLRDPAPRRLALVAWCAAGAWLTARLTDPAVATRGLCGLSGVAHGLMAWQALAEARAATDRRSRLAWLGVLAGVAGKCAWEVATGGVLLAGCHLGDVGSPVPATHAGGVLAALGLALAEHAKAPAGRIVRAWAASFVSFSQPAGNRMAVAASRPAHSALHGNPTPAYYAVRGFGPAGRGPQGGSEHERSDRSVGSCGGGGFGRRAGRRGGVAERLAQGHEKPDSQRAHRRVEGDPRTRRAGGGGGRRADAVAL